jgi:hypothetical protein
VPTLLSLHLLVRTLIRIHYFCSGGNSDWKVKFLDTDLLLTSSDLTTSTPSTTNPAAGSGIIEYVATFPNVTVNAGDEHKACVLTTKDLEPICTAGNNSPAHRAEL